MAPQMGESRGRKFDISATWLSRRDPLGFPPHPRGWFSIIVYQVNVNVIDYSPVKSPPFLEIKKPGRRVDISAARLSQRDPWAFRPILADGLVVSFIINSVTLFYNYPS
jgi:hypothetical protein